MLHTQNSIQSCRSIFYCPVHTCTMYICTIIPHKDVRVQYMLTLYWLILQCIYMYVQVYIFFWGFLAALVHDTMYTRFRCVARNNFLKCPIEISGQNNISPPNCATHSKLNFSLRSFTATPTLMYAHVQFCNVNMWSTGRVSDKLRLCCWLLLLLLHFSVQQC